MNFINDIFESKKRYYFEGSKMNKKKAIQLKLFGYCYAYITLVIQQNNSINFQF